MDGWIQFIKRGENINQTGRIKGNWKTIDNQIPILSGTNKDHKEAPDKVIWPDFRPIMGAMGPQYNTGLSELGSIIVRKIADNSDNGLVAKSKEEIINKFEEFNRSRFEKVPELNDIIIASMDIEKFYTNIISEESAKTIRRMWEDSTLTVDEIIVDKLSRYLGIHLKKNEIEEEGFDDIVYKKKPNGHQ